MEQFFHQTYIQLRCPRCGFRRSWQLRRRSRRCQRCRTEWTPCYRLRGFRAPFPVWRGVITAFLRERTAVRVAEVIRIERHCIHRMLHRLRTVMAADHPLPFSGTVEMDETYIGGQWRNKRWAVRRHGTKRGHGTSKQAVLGMLHRDTGQVAAVLVPNLQWRTLGPIIGAHVAAGSTIYTDGADTYEPLRHQYHRERVEHVSGEYVRGVIHTNGIESFWGYLKRRLKTTGGIRAARLPLYVAEEVWRFNHRTMNLKGQVEILYRKLVEEL